MIACRPQEIWLTFDFDPLGNIPANEPNFGGYDYSRHIDAYIKMYELFRKYGIVPIHYAEKHLAPASLHGKELLRMVKARLRPEYLIQSDLDLRVVEQTPNTEPLTQTYQNRIFHLDGDVLKCDGVSIPLSDRRLEIGIAPASHHVESTIAELSKKFNVRSIIDKDVVYTGKKIGGIKILSYQDIRLQKLDSIIAEQVMLQLLQLNTVCLPVHDSFIVQFECADLLVQVMKKEYEKILKQSIEVDREEVFVGEGFAVPSPTVLVSSSNEDEFVEKHNHRNSIAMNYITSWTILNKTPSEISNSFTQALLAWDSLRRNI
jgi:hypothetical protein